MKLLPFTLLLVAAAPAPDAIPDCAVQVLRPLVDDGGNRWPAGRTLAVTIARRDGGATSYCAHGGSCLPRLVDGREAARLVNCRIGQPIGGGDYRLVLDPRAVGAAAARRGTRRGDAERRLSDLGFSNAAAFTLADRYARAPASADGRRVAAALAGSRPALAALRRAMP